MDLLINTYGTRIRSSGERIVLVFPSTDKRKEYSIHRIKKIIILRPSSISTHAVKLALENDVDIVYLGTFGKPIGRVFPSIPKGLAQLRRGQLEISTSEDALRLARQFVIGKSLNQIMYLRYLQDKYKKSFNKEILQAETLLDSLQIVVGTERQREQLLGIEGYIADKYFSCWKKLFIFSGRNPRGRDKFNSALNYGYGILYNEVERACLYVGLDPYLGLYHSERYGKPSLVLDLVEEFRVPIVDSTVFPLFLEQNLSRDINFKKRGVNQYELSPEGKAAIVSSVFSRLKQEIAWEGIKQTVQASITHQVRSLSHYFLRKTHEYKPFSLDCLIQNKQL